MIAAEFVADGLRENNKIDVFSAIRPCLLVFKI